MQINPYLAFNGDCAEAMEFYKNLFGGEIIALQKYGDAPGTEEIPGKNDDHIMHMQLKIGDRVIMASDAPSELYEKPSGIKIQTSFDSLAEAERVFNALAEDGTVLMKFEPTFWAAGFGMLVDKWGTPWMMNCDEDRG